MKKFFLIAMLVFGMNTIAQTNLLIETHLDLTGYDIIIYNDNMDVIACNDLEIIDSTKISIILPASNNYTMVIGDSYYIDIFLVEDKRTEIVKCHINYDTENTGIVIFNDIELAALIRSKAYIKWEKQVERLDRKRYKHGGQCKSAKKAYKKWLELKGNPPH